MKKRVWVCRAVTATCVAFAALSLFMYIHRRSWIDAANTFTSAVMAATWWNLERPDRKED